jgi:hypothetical protein
MKSGEDDFEELTNSYFRLIAVDAKIKTPASSVS